MILSTIISREIVVCWVVDVTRLRYAASERYLQSVTLPLRDDDQAGRVERSPLSSKVLIRSLTRYHPSYRPFL